MDLNVVLDVPARIALGLANGTLERVGGVVRDASSKEVVMWLRDGTEASKVLSQPPLPNLPLGQAAQLANPLLGALNLGVSVAGFAVVVTQLNQISDQIRKMEAKIDRVSMKLDDQILAKLKAGITACMNAADLINPDLRQLQASQAITTLHEARQYFNQQVIRSASEAEAASVEYIAMAFTALMAEAQTYIQIDESKKAARVIRDGLTELRPCLTQLLKTVLSYRAAYLRPDFLLSIDLDFITWLHNGYYRMQVDPGEEALSVTPSEVYDRFRKALVKAMDSNKDWHRVIPQVVVDTSGLSDVYIGPINTGVDKGKRYECVKRGVPMGLARFAAIVECHDRLCGQVLQLEELNRSGIKPNELNQKFQLPEGQAGAIVFDARWIAQEVIA
jgi:hypothetical protein